MAKKTKHKSAAQRSVTSVSDLRAERAVDAVTPAFVEWCRQTEGGRAEEALEILRPVKRLVAAYFQASPSSEATNFEPGPFGLAVAETISGYDEDDEDGITFAFAAIHVYVEFLGETGAWTGTEENFDAVDELFHMDGEASLPEIVAPTLMEEEELAGLAGTGLARRLERLLLWLGDGRTVTSTGALRLKEIEGAAAAVGVAARGAARNAKREPLPMDDLGDASPEAMVTVNSMNQVPMLVKFWAALEASDLIEIGSTKAWPTPLAEEFLEPGHPGGLEVLRDFMAKFLAVAIYGENDWDPAVTQASMAQTAALYAACTEKPFPVEVLTDPAKLQRLDLDMYAAAILQERMDELAELGLVTLDKVITVPPAVVPAVAAVMQGALTDGPDDADDPWGDPWGAGPLLPGSPARQPDAPKKQPSRKRKNLAPAHILQLKVMLKGSKPPIWRRLLVRSDLTLEQMHRVIQMSFEWLGYHLHEFRVGGWPGTSYGPAGGDDDGFGDPPLDEASVTIGELLTAEKDSITYTYDFGDDWVHAITLEKTLPHDAGVPAVRCTGGRGRGPAEDCGGVWGWATVVEAVNDPAHEEHAEYREWLGMDDGERLDPKAFDKEELNEELVEMY
ncbi:plasmid pRiA4b ORF-3 family protein [Arthrobacter sp. STN4]|uniref:plasmid pRiA4b ORF-3 family protein n=1 Tax=Arthrobacter sp. STN4 TaxID=2923276 RepID=UPI00211A8CF2|nr:plasmid pRiA4b ORF-3 family protein [Arthrobacter sp. STN4]MCQ9162776.1 plasmid pRiA4b ORF-3 family protein [Arthrobacter sp. STN4]